MVRWRCCLSLSGRCVPVDGELTVGEPDEWSSGDAVCHYLDDVSLLMGS